MICTYFNYGTSDNPFGQLTLTEKEKERESERDKKSSYFTHSVSLWYKVGESITSLCLLLTQHACNVICVRISYIVVHLPTMT